MEHFAASSVGDAPVPSRDLACVIGGSEDQGGFVDEDEVRLLEIGLNCVIHSCGGLFHYLAGYPIF